MEAIIKNVYNNLRSTELISSDIVSNLKLYISKKYPSYDSKKTAEIFADAIHKMIDKKIDRFENIYKMPIKKQLLTTAINKQHFNLMANDVLSACLSLEIQDEVFLQDLCEWINSVQDISLPYDEFQDFLDKFDGVLEKDYFNVEKALDIMYTPAKAHVKNIPDIEYKVFTFFLPKTVLFACTLLIIITTVLCLNLNNQTDNKTAKKTTIKVNQLESPQTLELKSNKYVSLNKLNSEFKYAKFSKEKLKKFLMSRNSILVNEPYFSSIINIAKKYNIHPLLLIAITGQEQSFVPKSQTNAKKIANNPFNVYGSWIEYNTNIQNSAEIAAQTIIVLSNDKPKNADTIKWINNRYAEDPKWFLGVSSYFKLLKKITAI